MSALLRKELRAYFDTPAAYVVSVVMLLISGWLFAQPLFLVNLATLAGLADNLQLLLVFFVPALAMRLYAEEQRAGTLETLSALPVSDLEVLAAKFLSALAVLTFMLAGTLFFPATLSLLGDPDWGATAGAYAGLWLEGAALAAAGLWASSLTRNQVVAFITAFLIGFVLFLVGKVQPLLPPAAAPLLGFLGFDSHLETLSRGVLDTRDLVYFASLAGFFLHLTHLRRTLHRVGAGPTTGSSAALGALLSLGVLAFLNLVSWRLHLRADLSEGRVYSLSAGSKRILSGLGDPVDVSAYFSKELPPQFAASRAYLQDLLSEYRSASRGQVRFRFVDADLDEAAKREALGQGIAPVQFNVVSREKYEVRDGFMGLAIRCADRKEVLPVVSKPESLEYDLTSAIVRLTQARKKVLGMLSSHGALGLERLAPGALEELRRHYDLRPVDLNALKPGAAVPSDVEALLALGPQERLSEGALYALDQFLLSGRPLGLALDAKRADFSSFMAAPLDTGLPEWLARQGIELRPELVLDSQCQKVQLTQNRGWFMMSSILEYPPFPVATDLDGAHPLTRGLNALTFPLAAPVSAERAAGSVSALARSSKRSWLRSAWSRGRVCDIRPGQDFSPAEGDPRGPFTLAVAVEGPFTSGFAPPLKLPAGADPKAFLAKSARPGRLFVAGTSRFASPDMPAGEAGMIFLLNLADWLALEGDLAGIRSKTSVFRPLSEVSAPAKALLRWANLVGPSAFVILFGLHRLRRRRAARDFRRALYGSRPAAAPPPADEPSDA